MSSFPATIEEKVLLITADIFLAELSNLIAKDKISDESRILFVNDGSRDATWNLIQDLAKRDGHFCGISLSRNRGHQNAVLAGLMEAKDAADITISIDCDGQDDIRAMEQMVDNTTAARRSSTASGAGGRRIRVSRDSRRSFFTGC